MDVIVVMTIMAEIIIIDVLIIMAVMAIMAEIVLMTYCTCLKGLAFGYCIFYM